MWLSSRWKNAADATEVPVRLNQTIFDQLSDQFPSQVWPVARWIFAFVAAVEIFLMLVLLTTPLPPTIPRPVGN
jgi:hypothetical protein